MKLLELYSDHVILSDTTSEMCVVCEKRSDGSLMPQLSSLAEVRPDDGRREGYGDGDAGDQHKLAHFGIACQHRKV